MISQLASTVGATTLGVVGGMAYGNALGAIPMRDDSAAPQTSGAAAPKTTADGTPVSGTTDATGIVHIGAILVLLSLAVLMFGSRFFKDARVN